MMHPKINNLVAFNATKHFSIAGAKVLHFFETCKCAVIFLA